MEWMVLVENMRIVWFGGIGFAPQIVALISRWGKVSMWEVQISWYYVWFGPVSERLQSTSSCRNLLQKSMRSFETVKSLSRSQNDV